MKKINFNSLAILLSLIAITWVSCDPDEPTGHTPEEVITTLIYTLTPTSGGDVVTFKFEDLDGDGGNDPVITNGELAANTTYEGSVELLNESETPAEDITEEVKEEDEDHQFFFSSTVTGLTVAYGDMDADGNPIGLATTLTTTDAGTGDLQIILRHEPVKTASGVADGNIDNADGETDIEVIFSVNVK